MTKKKKDERHKQDKYKTQTFYIMLDVTVFNIISYNNNYYIREKIVF